MYLVHFACFVASFHLGSRGNSKQANGLKRTMYSRSLNTHRNFSQVRHIHYNRSIWNYMGNSCHNWQIMVQVLVNFYDSKMCVFWKFKKSNLVGLENSGSSKETFSLVFNISQVGVSLHPQNCIPGMQLGQWGCFTASLCPEQAQRRTAGNSRRVEAQRESVGCEDPSPPSVAGLTNWRLIQTLSNLLGFISWSFRVIFQVKQKNWRILHISVR